MNPWSDTDVEKHWDQVAHVYVKENNKVKDAHDQRFIECMKYIKARNGDKIINISSRDCEANDYLKKKYPNIEVINAEISSKMIEIAREIRPYAEQVKIDTYSVLPFDDNIFDCVISLETLEHVENPIKFLSELHRISTKGARLILSCPPATSEIPYQIYTRIFGGHGEGPHKFLTSNKVIQLLKTTNWNVIVHRGTVLIPIGPKWLRNFGEILIEKFQDTPISEFGIRQFYVCEKF